MPPAKRSRSRPSPARKAAGARKAADPESTREQLQRLLDPREVVVVTRNAAPGRRSTTRSSAAG